MNDIANLVTEDVAKQKPSEDGWPLSQHLCHVHLVRLSWFNRVRGEEDSDSGYLYTEKDGKWIPSEDLPHIRAELDRLGVEIGDWLAASLEEGKPSGGYDHPAYFLQHMIWHEGWHIGLIMLGLRLAGKEPTDEWEESHLWGRWRVE